MKQRRVGLAIVVLLAALLVALPPLAGCGGGGGGEENVITIGIMADFTGTAGTAMQPTIEAFQEYLERVLPASDNPLEGVKIEFCEPFDTQLDYSKVPGGYEILKARGTELMVIMNAQDKLLLADTPANDGMPVIGTMGLQAMLADEWSITTWSPIQTQGEVQMLFIMDDWDYDTAGRSPKVAHLGYTLVSSDFYQEGIKKVMDANAGKFTWGGFERGALGNVAWTSEVSRLKTCDYIIVSCAGAMLSSFVVQARAAGYTGKFITGMEGFPGFWPLVTDAMAGSLDQLYGCYYVAWWPWWNEAAEVPVIQDCKDYIAEYHAGNADELLHSSAVISGRELGMAVEMAIRNAIEAVGAENVDRTAIKNGLRAIDEQLPGYINKWELSSKSNALQWKQRAFLYNVSADEFEPLPTVYDPVLTRPA